MGFLPESTGDAVYELSSLLLGNYVLLYGNHQARSVKERRGRRGNFMLANVNTDSEDTFFKSLFHKLECALKAMFGYKQSNTHLEDNWEKRFMDLFRKTNQCTKDLVLMVDSTGMLLRNRNVALQFLQTIREIKESPETHRLRGFLMVGVESMLKFMRFTAENISTLLQMYARDRNYMDADVEGIAKDISERILGHHGIVAVCFAEIEMMAKFPTLQEWASFAVKVLGPISISRSPYWRISNIPELEEEKKIFNQIVRDGKVEIKDWKNNEAVQELLVKGIIIESRFVKLTPRDYFELSSPLLRQYIPREFSRVVAYSMLRQDLLMPPISEYMLQSKFVSLIDKICRATYSFKYKVCFEVKKRVDHGRRLKSLFMLLSSANLPHFGMEILLSSTQEDLRERITRAKEFKDLQNCQEVAVVRIVGKNAAEVVETGDGKVFVVDVVLDDDFSSAKIICSGSDTNVRAATYSLTSYGIPFDKITIDNPSFNGNFNLEVQPDKGRYSLLVLTSDSLTILKNGIWMSGISNDQFEVLKQYQIKYGIRQITLNSYPNPVKHFATVADVNYQGCCSGEHLATFTEFSPITRAGLKFSAILSTEGLYHYPSQILNTTAAKPILIFKGGSQPQFPADTVGAVVIRHIDNREEMVFFISFSDWSLTSLILGHMWIDWGTRGLYMGNRQIYLGTQIDDFFLETEGPTLPNQSSKIYSTSPSDMDNLAQWRRDLHNRLPKGSNFKIELAYNAIGMLMKGNPAATLNIDSENYVLNDFVKPLGGGDNRWPNPVPSDADIGITNDSIASSNPLFNYFNGPDRRQKQSEYFWLSHTFTHENLNNASYRDANLEVSMNIKATKSLLKFFNESYFSPNSIVTPQISGLRNGDAIKAIVDNGINYAVGDDSRPELISDKGVLYPLITTNALSNYNGFMILPRSPCEVYFFSGTAEENTYVYNSMYQSVYGKSTNLQIMEREAERVLYKLMALHPGSYMFHQANLVAPSSNVTIGLGTGRLSLLQQWVEVVVFRLGQIANWPVTTLKQDDLAKVFVNRMDRDNCGLKATLNYDSTNSSIESVQIQSAGTCVVEFTIPQLLVDISLIPSAEYINIGDQPKIVKLQMSGNSINLRLSERVSVK
ncbi:hypothetical protein HK098_007849 [Nowakowskiella sp. JEL0407]|nr:hypothetical protein HK098_007849 [Nowakowskiella sp. JEL0407]